MKKLFRLLAVFSVVVGSFQNSTGFAQSIDHSHYTKHNFVLFGESGIYASHIVYKVPHNYQVILRIEFKPAILESYLKARRAHPDDEFIFLLDSMDISEISSADSISGVVFRIDKNDAQFEIAKDVRMTRGQFNVIYFNELPLSLAANQTGHMKSPLGGVLSSSSDTRLVCRRDGNARDRKCYYCHDIDDLDHVVKGSGFYKCDYN